MLRKTEAIGLDVMKLGSALAVIRYNEAYTAISLALEMLQLKIHPGLLELLSDLERSA